MIAMESGDGLIHAPRILQPLTCPPQSERAKTLKGSHGQIIGPETVHTDSVMSLCAQRRGLARTGEHMNRMTPLGPCPRVVPRIGTNPAETCFTWILIREERDLHRPETFRSPGDRLDVCEDAIGKCRESQYERARRGHRAS